MSQPELMMSLSTARALLALQPYAVAARDEAGPFPLSATAEKPSWRPWSSFGMRLSRRWGRVEMVAVLEVLNDELEGLNAQARELEVTIAKNVAGILEVSR